MKQKLVTKPVIRSLRFSVLFVVLIVGVGCFSISQVPVSFNDFSAFSNFGAGWKLAGKATADLKHNHVLITGKGTGILVYAPGKKVSGSELQTKENYSDLDLELDYLVAKNSSAGIYLQGRYKIQLRDSWGLLAPGFSDNGGIGERYDSSHNEGYDGHAPRQNVSRAPGLWQHLKIAFQSAKFDASGVKTINARILRIELNGVLIQENVELSGPARGSVESNELAAAPLRLQGEQGSVAFRNMVIRDYSGKPPILKNIHYRVYHGKYETVPDFSDLKPTEEGDLNELSTSFMKQDEAFLIRYTGTIRVQQPGLYIFQRETNGKGAVKINNQEASNIYSSNTTPIQLAAGEYPFEIVYTKPSNWFPTSFGFTISANNVREFLASDKGSLSRDYPDPIFIESRENFVNRSFMDIPGGPRVVHSANVASPRQLHYSYDMDNGMLFQVWRGSFLDATPMWYARGDGSSLPTGSRLQLGMPRQTIIRLNSLNDSISSDTSGTGFITKGYELYNETRTTFLYTLQGASVRDAFEVAEDGQSLKRSLNVSNNPGNMFILLAESEAIEKISKGWYLVGDKAYYIRIDDSGIAPVIRQSQGHYELLAPLHNHITYSILF